MIRPSLRLRTAVVCAMLLPPALTAQQRDTVRDTTDRPFVRGGMFDKPHQNRLFGRTAIGGYAEAHARWQEVEGLKDDAGFEAKRFNLFTNTRVSDFVRIGAEIEFEEGGQEVKLEYAAIDLLVSPALVLRGGMLLTPLGKFNLAHDSPLNEFTDRPLVSTELIGVALSEPGFGILGQLRAVGSRVTYELYATNGFHAGLIDDSDAGTRIPLGRGNFEDNNGSPAFVGRLAVSPGVDHEVGVSVHRGAYNVFNLEGTPIDDRRDLTIAVLDAETRLFGTTIGGEAALARIDVPPGLSGIYASRQHGWYVEGIREFGAGWLRTMPMSLFALKTRWDYVKFDADIDGESTGQLTVGMNFRPTRETALKFDYVRGRGRDRFNNRADHAFILGSIATYF
ncbi:MAG TPA: hypothetical protein VEB19_00900 [Gemmatimonadaceae bacterium]|nr:hypothetical protein [Gemmatimonadaceae bacterium]